ETSGNIRRHAHRDDPRRVRHRLTTRQLVDMLHALDHLPPNGVLAVEEFRIIEADEELAVGAVRMAGARHGRCAANMRLAREFRLELAARAAHPGPGR